MSIMYVQKLVTDLWCMRSFILVPVVLLATLPIMLIGLDDEMSDEATNCLCVLIVMAVLWVTESLPIAVTSLFPLVMFPLAGVMTASDTASAYVNNTSMLFFGGLVVAVAVGEWQLHKRISLMVMMVVGSDPKWVMAGLMIPTWFLSMWITNIATVSVMLPICQAVLHQIKSVQGKGSRQTDQPSVGVADGQQETRAVPNHNEKKDNVSENGIMNLTIVVEADVAKEKSDNMTSFRQSQSFKVAADRTYDDVIEDPEKEAKYERLCKGLTICIAYAASIGGIATLTGCLPNAVLQGQADELYKKYQKASGLPETGSPISFANLMGLAFPLSLITLVCAWLLLVIFFTSGNPIPTSICRGCYTHKKEHSVDIRKLVRADWNKLGRITMAEIEVLLLVIVLATLGIMRDLKGTGWESWFSDWLKFRYASDTTPAILIAILFFMLPAKIPNVFWFYKEERAKEPVWTPLLTWEKVQKKLPWGVIILLGGGFALAKGVRESGLDQWLASKLTKLDHLDNWVFNLVLCLIVAAVTEFTSNTATANLLMAILPPLAIYIEVNPLYFMISCGLTTSFAFMLPVSTPPNAIVFCNGHIKVIDMVKVGFFMNIIAVAALTLAVNTWGKAIYDFGDFDPIFKANFTAVMYSKT